MIDKEKSGMYWVGARVVRAAAACMLLAATTGSALAQSYPTRPVRLVVGFPSGTGPDLVARLVAQKLQEFTGQGFVVDNKTGAAGLIAAREAAKAPPDGYTLFLGTVGEMAIAPSSYTRLGFDPVKDFAAVSHVVTSDFAFVVPTATPAKNLKEYVEWGKSQKSLFMGTFGAGTPGHFGVAMLADATGLKAEPVHYKNTGDAMSGIIAGDTQGLFGTLALVSSHVKGGKLRALATTGAERSTMLPDVPTAKEQGYPSVEFGAWFGIYAPAKTPNDILDKLNGEVVKAMQAPDVREKLQGVGFRVVGSSRQEFDRLLKQDIPRWEKVVKATGFKAQE
ncbi:MAG TPA: tripartite tricarboxylate transporter substrate binding protein [Noviherbaspirillum sp.]|uniref:Bug family tripartite tricarboxylate transporter substrate binding protein n=1 Tax=Noviherbaspirillum sp. TaxID=1926288 RepID=UPI002DDDBBC9|nr:tripartite tricarboxylate transporter substrate binding protein [Noviherbaspirillum sp.]HEV2613030.1 tripartite tricarboxylate transporter substrate binding protein [Noviherbaspirillum sp.]